MALFGKMLERAAGSLKHVPAVTDVPTAVAEFLRQHNLPLSVRRGGDALLASVPWQNEPALEVSTGASDGQQLASVSHAFGGVAETGTLVLTAGPDNPTTLNFLPDNHVVVIEAKDIAGDFESVLTCLRKKYGVAMPRVVNFITGPSRSADIEQTLILGAHGPRRLHVIVVGEPVDTAGTG
jgi:L-lactate dehydrogenase complex protein LldG